jgi:copper(I)-binding protein
MFRPTLLAAAVAAALFAMPALAQVDVSDPWVRGTVGGQKSTGAFMKLTAAAEASLVGASSPAAKVVEIHEMKLEGGVMQMRAVHKVALPAGKAVELKPGGYHVMLMGLAAPLAPGETVPITLTIEDKAGKRTNVEVRAPVRPLTSSGDMPAKKH